MKWLRKISLFLFFVLVLQNSVFGHKVKCDLLLDKAVRTAELTTSLKADFTLKPLNADDGLPVFKLTTPDGDSFVLRIARSPNELIAESFLTLVAGLYSGVRTPKVKKLNNKEKLLVLATLQETEPNLFSKLRYTWKQKYKDFEINLNQNKVPMEISLAEWVEGQTGEEFVNSLFTNQKVLSEISKIDRTFKAEDYHNFTHYLADHRTDPEKSDQIRQILKKAFDLHHPGLDQKIDEAWILNIVLGLYDMNPTNWILTKKLELVLFDFSTKPLSTKNTKHPLFIHTLTAHPFLLGMVRQAQLSAAIKNLSPEFVDFLKSLTQKTLKKLADEANFPAEDSYLESIIYRANHVISKVSQL